jgi:hypothetical protein
MAIENLLSCWVERKVLEKQSLKLLPLEDREGHFKKAGPFRSQSHAFRLWDTETY